MHQAISHTHSFPLEQLFLRLEMAGFALSPADRLRALQILDGPAKNYLHAPEQLKKLLAPALVRSATEQEKFYEIFDLYLKDIQRPLKQENKPKKKTYLSWMLLALVISILTYSAYRVWEKRPTSSDLSIYIEGPTYASVGDTLTFFNLSKFTGDSSTLKWQWQYGTSGQKAELLDSTHFNWTFVVPPLSSGVFQKEVRLSVYYPEKDSLFESKLNLSIFCPSEPAVNGIKGKQQLNAGEDASFNVMASNTDLQITRHQGREMISGPAINWTYDWDFGDGTYDQGYYLTRHTYEKNGLYRLRLTVTDTTGEGFCSTTHTLEVKVGAEQAFLPLASLQKDRLKPLAVWNWAYYILLGLLGIGIVYHWVRWLTQSQNRHKSVPSTAAEKALYARFQFNDKAPYFIPLRGQDQQIQPAAQHLRFADALRLRQEGLRKEINVNATLRATINKGGFPSVVYGYATQPSEYLFLIDEQNRASHLGRLFKYLAKSLRGQDVNMEIFHYRLHFNRFWNHHYPSGLTIEQLRKEFPAYRLVVLGDLHELIDPHAKIQPQLRPALANILKQWPQRLLLSAVPPVSWSYREKLLARVFNIFPADVDGIAAAALHFENDGELLIDGLAFESWKDNQIKQRRDNDTEHRRWRRWQDIEGYLAAYPEELTRWFKALAVFPMNSWEMTIAIGHALGIQITYDKLLQLARIPALQQDRFDERLRQDLLATLDQEDELRARKAVRDELEAIKAINVDSAASRDLETTLAIQTFSLDPNTKENQDTIRFLLQKGILSPAQEKELDWVSTKHIDKQKPTPKTKSITVAKKPLLNIREWLKAGDYVSENNNKINKRFNDDFWKALLLTISYTFLLIAGWQLGGTDALYNLTFWEDPNQRTVGINDPLRDYYFIKESLVVDSAIIYNNLGVDRSGLPEKQDTSTAHYFQKALASANTVLKSAAETFQGKAITYSLANANLAKLYHNTGVNYLNQYLNDSLGQAVLPEALNVLDKAYISDSIAWDVWHAKGVIHYYLGSPEDSMLYYYRVLDSLGYFASLNYSPNLKTLLGRERSRIVDVAINKKENQRLEVQLDYYLNTAVDTDAFLTIRPVGMGNQPDEQIVDLDSGPASLSINFTPPSRLPGKLTALLIQLHRRPDNDIIDSREEAYAHNWARPTIVNSRTKDPPAQMDSNNENPLSFYIRGQVIDDISRKGIANATVVLAAPGTRTNQEGFRLATGTDSYGEFYVRGELPLTFDTPIILTISRTGYQTMENNYTADEIISFSEKGGLLIRLENKVAIPNMIQIKGGTFERTDQPDSYIQKKAAPIQQSVTVGDFFISPYELTYAAYDLFCEMTAREKAVDNGWGRGDLPVTQITWLDAIDYCNWLSEQHGFEQVYARGKGEQVVIRTQANGYRLPTEAEWEYAARGGLLGDETHIYAGSSDIEEVAWYDGNSKNRTHQVGQKQPNKLGLYDMSGNVWEWCQDWYAPYAALPQENPLTNDFGSDRIYRGGAWIQQAADCQVNVRQYDKPKRRSQLVGFRLAR